MTIRVGINGFGRTGRTFLRNAFESAKNELQVVYINDANLQPEQMAYFFKYDSVHGKFKGSIDTKGNNLYIDKKEIRVSQENDPSKIKWKDLDVDFVIEATGNFTSKERAEGHLKAGARRVIITAPSKDAPTFVCGVNLDKFTEDQKIISNASETTHCAAILLSRLNSKYKVLEGSLTAVHAATSQQRAVDSLSDDSDWRTGRSSVNNIIPAPTTASHEALCRVLPELKGKVNAGAYIVPTVDVSVLDLVVRLEQAPKGGYDEVLKCLGSEGTSDERHRRLVEVTQEAVVSTDLIGRTESAIIDAKAGRMIGETSIKLVAWYDNEWGYSRRLVELILFVAQKERERK